MDSLYLQTYVSAVSLNNPRLQLKLIANKMQLFWVIYFNQFYMFRAMFSPIIKSILLQLQPLVISTVEVSREKKS